MPKALAQVEKNKLRHVHEGEEGTMDVVLKAVEKATKARKNIKKKQSGQSDD